MAIEYLIQTCTMPGRMVQALGIAISRYWQYEKVFLESEAPQPGPRLNIKTIFPRYGDTHVKVKWTHGG